MKRLFVRPNEKVKTGLPEELQIGWVIKCADGKDVFRPWGSVANDSLFKLLLQNIIKEHGDVQVVDLRRKQ